MVAVPIQVDKMRVELANQHHCAVPFQSRAGVNFSWYDSILIARTHQKLRRS